MFHYYLGSTSGSSIEMVRRGLPRCRKGEESTEDENKARKHDGSKRKRPPEGSVQRALKRGRTDADRHAALAEDIRRRLLSIEFQLLSEPIIISRLYMPGYPTCKRIVCHRYPESESGTSCWDCDEASFV